MACVHRHCNLIGFYLSSSFRTQLLSMNSGSSSSASCRILNTSRSFSSSPFGSSSDSPFDPSSLLDSSFYELLSSTKPSKAQADVNYSEPASFLKEQQQKHQQQRQKRQRKIQNVETLKSKETKPTTQSACSESVSFPRLSSSGSHAPHSTSVSSRLSVHLSGSMDQTPLEDTTPHTKDSCDSKNAYDRSRQSIRLKKPGLFLHLLGGAESRLSSERIFGTTHKPRASDENQHSNSLNASSSLNSPSPSSDFSDNMTRYGTRDLTNYDEHKDGFASSSSSFSGTDPESRRKSGSADIPEWLQEFLGPASSSTKHSDSFKKPRKLNISSKDREKFMSMETSMDQNNPPSGKTENASSHYSERKNHDPQRTKFSSFSSHALPDNGNFLRSLLKQKDHDPRRSTFAAVPSNLVDNDENFLHSLSKNAKDSQHLEHWKSRNSDSQKYDPFDLQGMDSYFNDETPKDLLYSYTWDETESISSSSGSASLPASTSASSNLNNSIQYQDQSTSDSSDPLIKKDGTIEPLQSSNQKFSSILTSAVSKEPVMPSRVSSKVHDFQLKLLQYAREETQHEEQEQKMAAQAKRNLNELNAVHNTSNVNDEAMNSKKLQFEKSLTSSKMTGEAFLSPWSDVDRSGNAIKENNRRIPDSKFGDQNGNKAYDLIDRHFNLLSNVSSPNSSDDSFDFLVDTSMNYPPVDEKYDRSNERSDSLSVNESQLQIQAFTGNDTEESSVTSTKQILRKTRKFGHARLRQIEKESRENPNAIFEDIMSVFKGEDLYYQTFEKLKKSNSHLDSMRRIAQPPFSVETLVEEIQAGEFQFQRVQPKPKNQKLRWSEVAKIIIEREKELPTRDIVVTEMIKDVLLLIYTPSLPNAAHGYRTDRNPHTFIKEIKASCYTTKFMCHGNFNLSRIDYEKLPDIMRKKVKDEAFIELVMGGVAAGLVEYTDISTSLNGVPKPSALAYGISNVIMEPFDRCMEKFCEGSETDMSKLETRKKLFYQQNAGEIVNLKLADFDKKNYSIKDLEFPLAKNNRSDELKAVLYVRYANQFMIASSLDYTNAKALSNELMANAKKHLGLDQDDITVSVNSTKESVSFYGLDFNLERSSNTNSIYVRVVARMSHIYDKFFEAGFCDLTGDPKGSTRWYSYNKDKIIQLYDATFRRVIDYYNFVQNRAYVTRKIAYILQHSCAKTLSGKFKLRSRAKVFKRWGSDFGNNSLESMKFSYRKEQDPGAYMDNNFFKKPNRWFI